LNFFSFLSAMANIIDLETEADFARILKGSRSRLAILLFPFSFSFSFSFSFLSLTNHLLLQVAVVFFAPWSEQSLEALAECRSFADSNPSVLFLLVDADKYEQLASEHKVESVPTAIIFFGEEKRGLHHLTKPRDIVAVVSKELGLTNAVCCSLVPSLRFDFSTFFFFFVGM